MEEARGNAGLRRSIVAGAVLICLAAPAGAGAAPVQFSGVGGSGSAGGAFNAKNAFQVGIGGPNNGAMVGSQPSGFRAINWDGVPDSSSSPNPLPPDFFNVNSPRGALFGPFEVRVSSNASAPVQNFGDLNGSYAALFHRFSDFKLFSPVNTNITDVTFAVPGQATRGTVSGFGSVFTNNHIASTSSLEYFDVAGNSLGKFFVPTSATAGDLEFLGVIFNAGERVARVRITSGNVLLGTSDSATGDPVVMDDFVYAEPQAGPVPTLSVTSPADNLTTSDSQVRIDGVAGDGGDGGIREVTVGSQIAAISFSGGFSTVQPLNDGVNHIPVVVTNSFGNRTEVDRTITRVPPSPGTVTTTNTVTNTVTTSTAAGPPVLPVVSTPGASLFSGFAVRSVQRGRTVAFSLDIAGDNSTVVGRLRKPSAATSAARKRRKAPTAFGSVLSRGLSAGHYTLRIPVSAAGRALVKKNHKLALAVQVTVTSATGTAQSATGRTTLK